MTIAEEYQAEREKLELNRALDWSTFSQEYIAAGEVLEPMTVQVWFDLLALKSPIIMAETPTLESIVDYVWRNCKRHTKNSILKKWRLFWIQRKIEKCLANREQASCLTLVLFEHIKNSFDEFPVDASQATSKKTNSMPSVAGEAALVDEIASRYAIHPDEVLTMPLRRAFTLQRTIRTCTIPEYKLLEPESLRAIKSKYLNNLNNGRK